LPEYNRKPSQGMTLAATLLIAACTPEPDAQRAATEVETPAIAAAAPAPQADIARQTNFIPDSFEPPTRIEGDGFRVVPLGPDLVDIDFAAYMSSIEHLQQTFSRSTRWPHAGITAADAMLDMTNEQTRFQNRESFAYAVLTPDGARERGCVYVYPSPRPGFDAMVRLWVTKAEYDAGFDGELYEWVQNWVADAWPFGSVAYPGRAIDWATWESLPETGSTIRNLATAETFIDAFYAFDAGLLAPLLEDAPESKQGILNYQAWAEGGNYRIVDRGACAADEAGVIRCPITVQDDPVLALKTGFDVTDTFALTFVKGAIVQIDTSSNDQPIYYQAREWVKTNMPEVMEGPCKGFGTDAAATPGDCARAMTAGYRAFAESADYPGPG
jgi:hypothetical protein